MKGILLALVCGPTLFFSFITSLGGFQNSGMAPLTRWLSRHLLPPSALGLIVALIMMYAGV